MRKVGLCSVVFGACFVSLGLSMGCARDRENCPKIDLTANTGTVNKVCPVVLADGIGKDAPRREWRGQTVGFCCDDCAPKWDSWSDARKDEALAQAMAKSK